MNSKHSSDHIKIMVATWNMQGQMPDRSMLDQLFQKDNVEHDMYILGSQESVRPIAQSMILPSMEKLNAVIMDYFNPKDRQKRYVMVNSISLAATHLIVVVKTFLAPYLSNITNRVLPIGVGEIMTNKSSECISFKLGDIRMLFINCHLEAHLPNLEKRNQQFENIHKKFVLQQTDEEAESKSNIICMPAKKKVRKIV